VIPSTRILNFAILLVVALPPYAMGAEVEQGERMEAFECDGTNFKVADVRSFFEDAETDEGRWPSSFFLQVSWPMDGRFLFPGPEDGNSWRIVSSLPSDAEAGRHQRRLFCTIFRRAFTKKWTLTGHPVSVKAPPFYERVEEEERIYVESVLAWSCRSKSDMITDERILTHRQLCATPLDTHDPRKSIYFSADLIAESWCSNVYLEVRPNFSDYTDARKWPKEVPVPVRICIALRRFLQHPFPHPRDILDAEKGNLIHNFSVAQDKLRSDEPVKLGISFGLDALSMSEIVRLKATNGGFQRQGNDIFYRADVPGEHTLTIEAMCGFHYDGKVDFAERREIKVIVKE